MDVYTTIEPYELAGDLTCEQEAIEICAEILKQWNLAQSGYAQILDEIPDFAIKQYLRKRRQKEKAHRERLTEILKNSRKTKNV